MRCAKNSRYGFNLSSQIVMVQMSLKSLPKCAFIALLVMQFAIIANANTYYVSATGSDSNNGASLATAWRSIQKSASHGSAKTSTVRRRTAIF